MTWFVPNRFRSLMRCDLTANALIGPIAPHTIICGVQNTLNVPLNFISNAPVLGSRANIFAKDCLNVGAELLRENHVPSGLVHGDLHLRETHLIERAREYV